jgi:hypothetical protein
MLIIAGVVWLILCVVGIVSAVGIIKSAKWGLMLTFVLGLLLVIMSVISFNIFGLVIGLFEAIYCGLRMFGNVGPRPA